MSPSCRSPTRPRRRTISPSPSSITTRSIRIARRNIARHASFDAGPIHQPWLRRCPEVQGQSGCRCEKKYNKNNGLKPSEKVSLSLVAGEGARQSRFLSFKTQEQTSLHRARFYLHVTKGARTPAAAPQDPGSATTTQLPVFLGLFNVGAVSRGALAWHNWSGWNRRHYYPA
jgi:hypothetical protein